MHLLPGPVVDEVFRDGQASVPLHVVDEILLPVAVVQDLEHEVQPPSFVGHHPSQALVFRGLDDVEYREHVRAERGLTRVDHRHFLGDVDRAIHRPKVQPQEIDCPRLGVLVRAALRHRVRGVGERVEDAHEEPLSRLRGHGLPGLQRRTRRNRPRAFGRHLWRDHRAIVSALPQVSPEGALPAWD